MILSYLISLCISFSYPSDTIKIINKFKIEGQVEFVDNIKKEIYSFSENTLYKYSEKGELKSFYTAPQLKKISPKRGIDFSKIYIVFPDYGSFIILNSELTPVSKEIKVEPLIYNSEYVFDFDKKNELCILDKDENKFLFYDKNYSLKETVNMPFSSDSLLVICLSETGNLHLVFQNHFFELNSFFEVLFDIKKNSNFFLSNDKIFFFSDEESELKIFDISKNEILRTFIIPENVKLEKCGSFGNDYYFFNGYEFCVFR